MDDFSFAGSLNSIKNYLDILTAIGQKYEYFPKPTKSNDSKKIDRRAKRNSKIQKQKLRSEYQSWRKKTPRCSYREYKNKFLTAVKGCHICNDKERAPISLPTRYGGLAIPYLMKHRKLNLWFASKSHQNLEHQFKKFTIQFNCR